MDVYQVLMQDHRIVEELFSEIEKSEPRSIRAITNRPPPGIRWAAPACRRRSSPASMRCPAIWDLPNVADPLQFSFQHGGRSARREPQPL